LKGISEKTITVLSKVLSAQRNYGTFRYYISAEVNLFGRVRHFFIRFSSCRTADDSSLNLSKDLLLMYNKFLLTIYILIFSSFQYFPTELDVLDSFIKVAKKSS
jgi:hypothetical protein